MRRAMLLAMVLVLGGCFHARHVERPGDDEQEEPASARGTTKPATPTRPGQPPVATSPTGLLRKDALEGIQKALAERGYLTSYQHGTMDEPTSAALRRFQKDQDLAETGAPDHETVRKLGLDPEEIYKAASTSGGSK